MISASPMFEERVAARLDTMSGAMQRVARFFQDNREEVLYRSAASLAARVSTSDATVVRTARALGFAGLDDMRRTLATEMKAGPSPAERLAGTLKGVRGDLEAVFMATLDVHAEAISRLRREIDPERYRAATVLLSKAQRVVIFGIGPSAAMADYLALQLNRFGVSTLALTRTGLLFADDVAALRIGDVAVIFAYTRVRDEVSVLLDHADRLGLERILVTDTLGPALADRVDLVLPAARGRADLFSMHAGTLALIETLLVGIAATRKDEILRNLSLLDAAREQLAGEPARGRRIGRRISSAPADGDV